LLTVGREVRYCKTADGVRLAYRIDGEGPAILTCPLFVESFSLAEAWADQRALYEALGRGRRLILFDMRGTGLSQQEVDDISPASLVSDLAAVIDAAGTERCSIFAHGEAGPRAIAYTAQNPDRVDCLVLWGTYARPADVATPAQLEAFASMCRENWPIAAQMAASISGMDAEGGPGVAAQSEIYRTSTDGPTAARILEATHGPESDVSELLPKVRAKTLVLNRVKGRVFRFRSGQEIAAGIPGAVLVPLEGWEASPLDPPTGFDEIDAFLRQHLGQPGAAVIQPSAQLTKRETEVLRLIAAGKTSSEVSRELDLSIRTVGRHITNIYTKIGAKGRADATAYALRHGICER
jgi:DNA-binding CsgD family transcriptional regulator/pimeloyl-ACP methyl ester carboxylesterase